jgi:hypothetical protein
LAKREELTLFDLVLRLGAVVIALLMAAVVFADQFGVGLAIRIANNIFADQIGDITVVSWLLIVLAFLEFITLVLLVLSHRAARST